MRQDMCGRYEDLQKIMMRHFEAAIEHAAAPALLDIARRLGLRDDESLSFGGAGESALLIDLGIFTAKDGRSRAIDRYAHKVRFRADSDEALVLDAMRRARFSVWRVERTHPRGGAVVADLLRKSEAWLPDADFDSAAEGITFASRLSELDGFTLACSIIVPVDADMLETAAADPLAFRYTDPDMVASDPRFATAIYRAAIDLGVLDFLAANGLQSADDADPVPAENVAEASA